MSVLFSRPVTRPHLGQAPEHAGGEARAVDEEVDVHDAAVDESRIQIIAPWDRLATAMVHAASAVAQDLTRRVVPARAHHAAAGVRGRAAQV